MTQNFYSWEFIENKKENTNSKKNTQLSVCRGII